MKWEENATLVRSETGTCPNWIYIDIIHGITNGNYISWTDTLNEFIQELYDVLYLDYHHSKFYVSIMSDCDTKKKYKIGTNVLSKADKVWVVKGYKDGGDEYHSYFYDEICEYVIN